jgi:hypothetical protein
MKYVSRSRLFSACLPACIAAALLLSCSERSAKDKAVSDLILIKKQVEAQLKNCEDRLVAQIGAFSRVVAADRDFSMKVLVEKDRSAPEVTELAPRYMEPMALSMLSIVNSHDTILSCGQFPASAGGPSPVSVLLGGTAFSFVMDNVKGRPVLTLQTKAPFTILDTVFCAIGGVVVDDNFCASLVVPPGFRVICKQGGAVTGAPGAQNVESISDVKDSAIVINNTTFPAVSLPLPYVGTGAQPSLVIMSNSPQK